MNGIFYDHKDHDLNDKFSLDMEFRALDPIWFLAAITAVKDMKCPSFLNWVHLRGINERFFYVQFSLSWRQRILTIFLTLTLFYNILFHNLCTFRVYVRMKQSIFSHYVNLPYAQNTALFLTRRKMWQNPIIG